ncbi:hypothetical protein [Embleya hyalina]|uniref:Uncharacterized protein n=1 Tax=Embleya hyalina TaxID=516124 RepID=A0A401Z001_9ACTN|nr:hypothetical protein [Embleya hyalina]GCE00187.1 hypothetical protein EHYA_07912 [Embleya hyalina]
MFLIGGLFLALTLLGLPLWALLSLGRYLARAMSRPRPERASRPTASAAVRT